MKSNLVCLSGGEASALVAVEVYRRYGNLNLVLLNHDISEKVEHSSIKRFKAEVAEYCGVLITFANMPGWESKDQFDVVVEAGAFKVRNGTALCTNRLKTRPFEDWLIANVSPADVTIYYGFSATEKDRIQRRASILGARGYRTEYPLASWPRTIQSTTELGITLPSTYDLFKHANCTGCLKAGMQHWYVVYCVRPDIWERGKWAEDEIGYTIIKGHSLESLEPKFGQMKALGIDPTENIPAATFWAAVRRFIENAESGQEKLPCECAV